MFADEAKIKVISGKGGDGVISFRRERFVPKGGPDGGDGGKGGSIWIAVSPQITTLSQYRRQKLYKAEPGRDGGKNNRRGKSGEDLILFFPRGTIIKIKNKEGELQRKMDLLKKNQKIEITEGGRGGHGNTWFKSSTRQTPRIRSRGKLGERLILELEVKLLADVGIIGLPNSGKSTLLSRISHARPKIADYPFTTIEPNLGMLELKELGIKSNRSIVLADIPGLIKDSSKGRGLGDRFLRHIERCKLLIHIIDGTSKDVISDYKNINQELMDYSRKLTRKRQIVVINKIDAIDKKELAKKLKILKVYNPIPISAVTGKGLKELVVKILDFST